MIYEVIIILLKTFPICRYQPFFFYLPILSHLFCFSFFTLYYIYLHYFFLFCRSFYFPANSFLSLFVVLLLSSFSFYFTAPLAAFPQQVQLLLTALLLVVLVIPVTTLSLWSLHPSSYPLWWISRFFVLFLLSLPFFVCCYAFFCFFPPISILLIFSSDSSVALFHAIFEAIFSFLSVNAWTFIIMLL